MNTAAADIQETAHPLAAPRFEFRDAMMVAGLARRFSDNGEPGIPDLWDEFLPMVGHMPAQIGMARYGIIEKGRGNSPLTYTAAVEVGGFIGLPELYSRTRLPAATYAVFSHDASSGPINEARRAIWRDWHLTGGHEIADTPGFELYDPDYDVQAGTGMAEIWLPLKM